MKPKLRIHFEDFWKSFRKTDNYFYNLLSQHYDVELSDNPDFLISSKFGSRHKHYKCVRIFFTGENRRPDLDKYDYAFTLLSRRPAPLPAAAPCVLRRPAGSC